MGHTFLINEAPYRGKQITVTKYIRKGSGVDIEITHNVAPKPGTKLRWCQTICENGSVFKACKRMNYVDPFDPNFGPAPGVCGADDNKPFYWTDAEEAAKGGVFSDGPREAPPGSGRSWIQFVTSLAEVTGNTVRLLVAVAWGFDRMAGGDVRVAALRTPTAGEMRNHGQTLKKMYPTWHYT
jgi:hypothetical protein